MKTNRLDPHAPEMSRNPAASLAKASASSASPAPSSRNQRFTTAAVASDFPATRIRVCSETLKASLRAKLIQFISAWLKISVSAASLGWIASGLPTISSNIQPA